MPSCGSQCFLCDVPIRFDTYIGCSHGCVYCFAKKFQDITKVGIGESPESLKRFIQGKRTKETNWCDWDIPLHWGGMSDPFQPCENKHGISYACLKILAETGYPFIVSTKGALVADEKYLSLIEECNAVVQISMVCSKYNVLERGCPSFEDRLKMLEKVSKRAKRTIVRVQPYMCEVYKDVVENLQKFEDAGAYGVVAEGMKFDKKKKGLVKVGGDFVYPYATIKNDITNLKEEAHKVGLKFYSGENRTRKLGDDLCCCGIDGLDGFKGNDYNLNHILNGDNPIPNEAMRKPDTAECFGSLYQTPIGNLELKGQNFADEMVRFYKNKKENVNKIMGVERV